jgi:protease I
MGKELSNLKVAFVVGNEGVEEIELSEPWNAVLGAGGQPTLVAPRPGVAQTMHNFDWAGIFPVDRVTEDALAQDYDGVVLPGGLASAEQLRLDAPAVDFIMSMFEASKPVAAICHGPWTLIAGGLVDGRTVTSSPSLETDLRNAGATWVNETVTVCRSGINSLVTCRRSSNVMAFCHTIISVFAEARSVGAGILPGA